MGSWGFFFSSDVAKSRSELYRQLVLLGEDFLCHLTTHEMTESIDNIYLTHILSMLKQIRHGLNLLGVEEMKAIRT